MPIQEQNSAEDVFQTSPAAAVAADTALDDFLPSAMIRSRKRKRIMYDIDESLTDHVSIYHPYYPYTSSNYPMLQFLASDSGAQYLMVYYACCIVAGNCTKVDEGRDKSNPEGPFLSTSPNIRDRITVPANDIIKAGNYFFIIPESTNPSPSSSGKHYAVTPTFDDWQPPEEIPRPWKEVEVPLDKNIANPADARKSDPCFISETSLGVEQAHIIPKAEERWILQNDIAKIVKRKGKVISDWRNKIPLRKDLHHLWDHGYLTFFPKCFTPSSPKKYVLSVHVNRLTPNTRPNNEMIYNYQNTRVEGLHAVPALFLYIRFAWSIFNEDVMTLFGKKRTYLVNYLVPTDDNKVEEKCDELGNKDIYKHKGGTSRLYSPRFTNTEPKKNSNTADENDDDYLSSVESGYLSPSESDRSSIYDYDWATDEELENDDTETGDSNTISRPIHTDDDSGRIVPNNKQYEEEKAQTHIYKRHHPVKEHRSSSNIDIKDSTSITSTQNREENYSASSSPNQPSTPNLSQSVETVKTDEDTVEQSQNSSPLRWNPKAVKAQKKICTTRSSSNDHNDLPSFTTH